MTRTELLKALESHKAKIESLEAQLEAVRHNREMVSGVGKDARYWDFMDSLADWFWEADSNLRFTYVSPNIERILGLPPEWFYGKTREEILGEDFDPALWQAHLDTLNAHLPFRDFTYLTQNNEGRARWFSTSGGPVFDDQGGFCGYRGTGRDVTEQVRSQEMFLAQEIRFRKLIENSLFGVCVHLRHTPLFANAAVAEMLGYDSKDAFLQEVRSIREVIHPEDLERLVEYNERRGRGEDVPMMYDARFLRRDGSPLWANVTAQVIDWEGDQSVLMTLVDISRRKQAEAESQARQQLLEGVFEALPMAFAIKDTQGRYLKVNGEMAAFYDLTVEKMTGMNTADLQFQGGDFGKVIMEEDREVITSRKMVIQPEYEIQRPSGESEIRYGVKLPILNKQGEVSQIVVISQDITDRIKAAKTLQQREEEYRALYDQTPVMMHSLDREGRISRVNRFWLDTMGYFEEEVVGRLFPDFLDEESRKMALEFELPVFFKTGMAEDFPYRMVKKSGDVIEVLVSARAEFDEQNKVVGSFSIIKDITEIKRYEARLQANEELLQTVFDTLPHSVYVKDMEGRYLMVNHSFLNQHQVSAEEFIGKTIDDLGVGTEEERRVINEQDRQILSSGKPIERPEFTYSSPNGESRIRKGVKMPLRGEGGRIIGLVGASEDITEQKEAERALIQNQALMAKAQEVAQFGHLELDIVTGRQAWSDEVFRIMGYPPQTFDPDAQRFAATLHPGDKKRVLEAISATIQGLEPFDLDCRVIRPDGTERAVHAQGEVIRDEGGNPLRLVGTAHDITDRIRAETALKNSRAMMAKGQEVAHYGTIDWNPDQDDHTWSDEVFRILGHPPQAFAPKGDDFTRALHPEDRKRIIKGVIAVAETGEPFEARYRIVRPDGSERTVEGGAELTRSELWDTPHVVGTIHDITDQVRMEEALRESEGRFKSTVANIPSAIFIKDTQGRYQYVNRQFEQWWGIANSEAEGKTTEELFPPLAARDYQRLDSEMLKSGRVREEEMIFPLANGSKRIMRNTKFPVHGAQGEITGIGTIITDIHDQKEAESALRDSRERLRQAAQLAQLGHWIFNAVSDRCQYCSEDHARIHGMTVAEYMMHASSSEGPGSLVHPEDRAEYQAARAALRLGEGYDREYRVLTLQGDIRHVREIARPILDENGNVVRERGTTQDITKLKMQEELLRQTQKMEAIGQLAGGVAHDFNNLLQVILGYAGLMLGDEQLSDFHRGNIGQIKEASERAATLTQQLLAFGRKQTLQVEPLDLNKLIIHQSHMVRRVIGETIEQVYQPQARRPIVLADAGMVEQVLLNLIINARDAMPEGGTLIVGTENFTPDDAFRAANAWAVHKEYVRITVTDTGIGMAPDVREHIFEPFFTTKEVGKGTGLGLAMVYGILQQHGGMIEVISSPGKGATFHVDLPLADIPQAEAKDATETESHGGSETILVAEDETEVRRLVSFLLESAGYTVLQATNGEEALGFMEARGGNIDLALVDLVMPILGGRDFYESLGDKWPGCRVLFTTGYAANAVDSKFLSSRQLRLIEKPYLPDHLFKVVREVLDGA